MRACMAVLAAITVLVGSACQAGRLSRGSAQKADEACAKSVIPDWYVDSRIDRTYPRRCYRAVYTLLPEDGQPKSEERLRRALEAKLHPR